MTATTIISIIAALGLGTPITVLLTGILNRKKGRVDAAEVVQGMAIGVAEEIRQQLKDVKDELAITQKTARDLETRVDQLEDTILAQNHRIRVYEGTFVQHNIPIPVV